MVTQPGLRSAATTLPRSSGSATPTESSPAGGCPQLTAQQCTQTPQSGVERPDPPICVHSCDPKATHSPSPQFNSVHKRPRSARKGPLPPICVHYCGYTGSPAAQQCTQTSQTGAESPDPLICVHSCGPQGCPLFNSVHKRPKPTRRGPILPFVYTIAAPRGRPRLNSVYKCT